MTEYNNPTPVAVAIVPIEGGGFLVGERAIEPQKGGTAFPGGYVEEYESAEQAAARELLEETGIDLPWEKFIPFRTRTNPRNNMLIFCRYQGVLPKSALDGFVANTETTSISIIYPGQTVCFPLHQEVLNLLAA